MGREFLVFTVVALIIGLPLLAGAIVLGVWLRRTQRACALRTWYGAAISGAVAFLACFGTIALVIAIALREQSQPNYFEAHPALPLLMIALGLFTLFSGFVCAVFGAWTLWRLVAAPPAQPVRTT